MNPGVASGPICGVQQPQLFHDNLREMKLSWVTSVRSMCSWKFHLQAHQGGVTSCVHTCFPPPPLPLRLDYRGLNRRPNKKYLVVVPEPIPVKSSAASTLVDRKVVSSHTRPVHMVVNQMAAEDLHIVHVACEWSLGSTRSKQETKQTQVLFPLMAQRIGVELAFGSTGLKVTVP